MPSDDRRSNAPQSVTRVIQILEALCASPRPMSLADLSRVLDTPKSSLAALLRGLAEEDFVAGSEGVWRLGPGHHAAVVSVVTDTPRPPADYKRRLDGLEGLSHVTVEVEPCPGPHAA